MDDLPTPADLRKSPYTILLVTLVLLLVVWPVIADSGLEERAVHWVHGGLFTLMLLAIVYAVRAGRSRHWFMGLVVVVFLADWSDHLVEGRETTVLGQSVGVVFISAVTLLVIQRVFSPGRITADRILAALCAYLLLGMIWSNLYWIIHSFHPDAFAFPADVVKAQVEVAGGGPGEGAVVLERHVGRQSEFTYFSFTTLTTLGYGEITPVHPLARSLAFLEAIVGQIFIAVVIARLVALEILHGRHGLPADDA